MSDNEFTRRNFVRSATAGIGATVGIGAGVAGSRAAGQTHQSNSNKPRRLARETWVASICQHNLSASSTDEMSRKMLKRMEEVLPMQPDIICLPECFHVANLKKGTRPKIADAAERPIGPISQPFADFARDNHCNVVCPIYTTEAGRYYNTAVVIDRNGNCVGEYRKINPTEGELDNGITPGSLDPPVFKLDIGTIGVQTCFDINWHENWKRLGEKGAEIVFWPSAFAGGEMLNSLAWINKYYVVSSTRIQATKIVDVLGNDVVSTGRFRDWVCAPINLDIAVIQGWQSIAKLEQIRDKYGRMVNVKLRHDEALGSVESLSPEVSIPDLLKEFDLETSNEMLARNTTLQKRKRPS